MRETSARLLRLLSLLQVRRSWSGPELADRLDVTTRTVRNDVEKLRSLGYPVEATPGAAGGYRLGAGAELPPLLLDDDEAVAVAVGLRTVSAVDGVEETAVRALAKLEQVLPSRLRRRVDAVQRATVTVPYDTPAPSVDAGLLATLSLACRDRERVRFRYRTHDGGPSRRAVEPLRLVRWGRRWYLVAWDVDRRDWRTFRVDRIEDCTPVGARFAEREPPAEDLAAYVSARTSAAAWRYRATVRLHAPAEAMRRRIPVAAGSLTPDGNDACLFRTGADALDTLVVWIGAAGVDFDVLDPPELAEHVAELGRRYTRAGAGAASGRISG
ncbi:helix-turn-helix transcriptional regulator [Jiangella rhizosphaerae]|uniref:YafY family transcriptional regulator n=1 Tax=Jiangella rhizosphaerae TaxID=2293569 RepID=A0A418KLW3_9ACTN|nr:YafY family protein [Jiangella rhizosphaerae]RIQ18929.1 YafY family transcriptional regulator [Jiangella rhizosphaerae]